MEGSPGPSEGPSSFKEKQSRRRSLPPPTLTKQQQRAASANQVRLQPASPEVISSLISSLETLSPPPSPHFDGVPPTAGPSRSTPSSPRANQTSFSPLYLNGGNGSGSVGPNDSHDHLHPDQAATPPVVRTSPARQSPVSAGWNGSDVDGATMLHNYWRGNKRTVSAEQDDGSNMRKLSLEPSTAPWDNMTRRSSASTETSRKNRRSHFGLKYTGSREKMREKENERRRSSMAPSGDDGLALEALETSISAFEEPEAADPASTEEPVRFRTTHLEIKPLTSSGPNSPGLPSAQSSPGIGPARFVPARQSSLRKTSHSRSQSKRRSYHSGLREPIYPSEGGSDTHSKRESFVDSKRLSFLDGDDGERDRTTYEPVKEGVATDGRRGGTHPRGTSMADSISASPAVASARAAAAAASAEAGMSPDDEPLTFLSKDVPKDDEYTVPSPPLLERRGNSFDPASSTRTIVTILDPERPKSSGRPQRPSSRPGSRPASRPGSSKGPLDTQSLHSVPLPERRNSRLQKRRVEPLVLNKPVTTPHARTFSSPLGRNSETAARPITLFMDDGNRPSSADSIDTDIDAYLNSERLSQKIPHPQTRRIISFSEVGDPEGFAVFCCVGMGLTRFITAFYDDLARSLKLRLITPDRPGIGESEPHADGADTPLGWPDDVYTICQALKISKFSILAHSAGAIYALATALRMSQHIRGRIHLLAPWIPPSQMSVIGSQTTSPPAGAVPTSQRILRALPTPVLKVANSSFMSATSSSITSALPRSPRRSKRKAATAAAAVASGRDASAPPATRTASDPAQPNGTTKLANLPSTLDDSSPSLANLPTSTAPSNHGAKDRQRQTSYDTRLTHAIWSLATSNANPAVDLLVCLERRAPIGFRYVDITRAVVIHHGSRDSRVPLENVRWLAKTMRRCEVRVLEGEGHGLMASAAVMGGVLEEIAREWADWMEVVRNGRERARTNGGKSEWGI